MSRTLRVFLSIYFLVFSLSLHSARATECDEYDHDGVMNLSSAPEGFITDVKKNDVALGPTRDQDEIGYCYAYASADLLEQWMKRHGQMPEKENVSAVALALRHDSQNWNPFDPLNSPVARIKKASALNQMSSIGANVASLMSYRLIKTSTILNLIADDLKKLTTDRNGVIQEGGFSNPALKRTVPSAAWLSGVLYESEVSSRDNGLKELVKRKAYELQSRANKPDDFKEGLLYLGEFFYADAPNSCAPDVADTMFPAAQIRNIQDLKRIAQEATDRRTGPFDQILNTARRNRTGDFIPARSAPPFVVTTEEVQDVQKHRRNIKAATVYPLEEEHNKAVLTSIDDALEKGEIVSFAYPAEMLVASTLPEAGYDPSKGRCRGACPNHESVISGKLKVCGKEYFVLRNSWGKGACSHTRANFINPDRVSELRELDLALAKTNYSEAEGERIEKSKERSHSSLIRKRARVAEVPYFCDADGNYIVRKDYLQKGIYTATRIQSGSP
ncbi:hypothetical protein EBZ37_02395 [bacterium]|nr:hypothetical protein [bacterium]